MKQETAAARTHEISPLPRRAVRRGFAWITVSALVTFAAACGGPVYSPPEEVKAEPPKVSYHFSTDQDLVEANTKARAYCSQYGASPTMVGSITENVDGTKTVTYECVKTAAVTPPPPPPMSYSYRTDVELLEALQSAEAYCARNGQVASSNIVTNPDGTKTLTFQCVPR